MTTEHDEGIAAKLRTLADLIDREGLPAPIGITPNRYDGTVAIQPESALDLALWCIHLDVPAPKWERYNDTLMASWPEATFDDLLVELRCADATALTEVTA